MLFILENKVGSENNWLCGIGETESEESEVCLRLFEEDVLCMIGSECPPPAVAVKGCGCGISRPTGGLINDDGDNPNPRDSDSISDCLSDDRPPCDTSGGDLGCNGH